MQEAERVLLAKNDGRRPFVILKEPVDFRLTDAAPWSFGIFLGVFDENRVGIGAVIVRAMFPDIPRHVIESEWVRWV